jgi:hypothetical protein
VFQPKVIKKKPKLHKGSLKPLRKALGKLSEKYENRARARKIVNNPYRKINI